MATNGNGNSKPQTPPPAPPPNADGTPRRPEEQRTAVKVADTIGGTVLDVYGLHPLTEAIRGFWRREGFLD